MLFMVIENLRDVDAVGARFQQHGRMLPDGVSYVASWGEPDGHRWFQLMEAPSESALLEWTEQWNDLASFEISAVLTSEEFWSTYHKTPQRR